METFTFGIYTLAFLVALALIFDFMNGFHDAANAIATIVSTGVLKPQHAVVFAAFFNVIAFFLFEHHVAGTIGKGTVDPAIVDHYVVFGALVGAICWNVITWFYGIPSSSSHALIGGLVGSAVAKSGMGCLVASGLLKTIAFIVISPLLGFLFGSIALVVVSWLCVKSTPRGVDKFFRRMQLVSCSLHSLGHGGNDAQKTMGIIWMLMIAGGYTTSEEGVPMWVAVSCYAAIGLGTLFGGWRIVKTMGQKITKLIPMTAFCAEVSGAFSLFIATALGIPVSTTHTITGAIVGVGSAKRISGVRWGVAGGIVWAWILTIPASAFIGAVSWWIGTKIM